MYVCMPQCMCGGHRTSWGSRISLSIMWFLGTELRLSGLAAEFVTSWAMSPALVLLKSRVSLRWFFFFFNSKTSLPQADLELMASFLPSSFPLFLLSSLSSFFSSSLLPFVLLGMEPRDSCVQGIPLSCNQPWDAPSWSFPNKYFRV